MIDFSNLSFKKIIFNICPVIIVWFSWALFSWLNGTIFIHSTEMPFMIGGLLIAVSLNIYQLKKDKKGFLRSWYYSIAFLIVLFIYTMWFKN